MAFTTGQVSKFTNTVISEVLGQGDGSTTNFTSLSVINPPVFIDSFTISYTISSTAHQATSDSNGNFSGPNLSSGTVDEDGNISLIFDTAPDNGTDIKADNYTAKGYLQKLREFVEGDKFQENVGAGDDVTTNFTKTLANTPIAKGQLRLEFTIATVEYKIYDNGLGEWKHDEISSSSIDDSTGDIDVIFANPPDDATPIDTTYVVGKNSGEEGRDWLLITERNSKDDNENDAFPGLLLKEIILKNSGNSFQDEVLVGFREFQNPTDDLFAINQNVYVPPVPDGAKFNYNDFQHGITSYSSADENWQDHPNWSMQNDTIQYWFFSNKRRICGVARSGSVYTSFYSGFGAPFAPPRDYSTPAVAVGSCEGSCAFSDISSSFVFIAKPKASSISANFFVIDPDKNYRRDNEIFFLPLSDFVNSGLLAKSTNGKIVNYPVTIVDDENSNTLMELDGVFACPVKDIQSEQTENDGADDYLIFQNIFRTQYDDFMAIKK